MVKLSQKGIGLKMIKTNAYSEDKLNMTIHLQEADKAIEGRWDDLSSINRSQTKKNYELKSNTNPTTPYNFLTNYKNKFPLQ